MIFLIAAAIFSGLLFKPETMTGELIDYQVIEGLDVSLYELLGDQMQTATVIIPVGDDRSCGVVAGRMAGPDLIYRIRSKLKDDSVITLSCEERTGVSGLHTMRFLAIDDEVLISLSDSRDAEQTQRSMYRNIAVFGWVLGLGFLFRAKTSGK